MSRRLLAAVAVVAAAALGGAAWLIRSSDRPASRVAFAGEGTGLAATDVQTALQEVSARLRWLEASQQAIRGTVSTELGAVQKSATDHEIRIAGQEARVTTLESWLAETTVVRTRLDYADELSAVPATEYARLRSIGAFTKRHPGTALLITWNTHVDATGDPGTFCDFQLRVDGRPDSEAEGGGARAVIYVPPGVQGGASAVSVSAFFPRVGAGSHTASVFVRGTARECQENFGNFPRSLLVEESPRG
jgi:hypothetical protein